MLTGCPDPQQSTSVEYTVNHYQENANDNDYTLCSTEVLYGYAGNVISYSSAQKSYDHFSVDSSKSTSSITLASSADNTLNIYYKRETCTITFYDYDGSVLYERSGKYEESFDSSSIVSPSRDGYTFTGWGYSLPASFTCNDTYYAQYTQDNTNPDYVTYSVQYLVQNGENTFETINGSSYFAFKNDDYSYSVSSPSRIGYTAEQVEYNGTAATDSSTVVQIKYYKDIYYYYNIMKENADSSEYSKYTTESHGPYKTGDTVTLETPSYSSDNYHVLNSTKSNCLTQTHTIKYASDENTFNVYYDCKDVTFTYDGNGGYWTDSNGNKQTTYTVILNMGQSIPSTDTIPLPLRDNTDGVSYTFASWSPAIYGTVVDDKTFKAIWTEKINSASYKVEYYLQNLDDEAQYTVDSSATVTQYGTIGTTTSVTAEEREGFTVNKIEQAVITAGGNATAKIYLDRNTITLNFYANNESDDVQTLSAKYGAAFDSSLLTEPEYTGCSFGGWCISGYQVVELPETFTQSTDYYALWMVSYKVHHKLEGLEGGWEEKDTDEMSVVKGVRAQATEKSYTGFEQTIGYTLNGVLPGRDNDVTIYYSRILYTVTFDSDNTDDDSDVVTSQYKYGKLVSYPAAPENKENEDKVFAGWQLSGTTTKTVEGTFTVDSDKTFTAVWVESETLTLATTVTLPTNGAALDVDTSKVSLSIYTSNGYPRFGIKNFTEALGTDVFSGEFTWYIDGNYAGEDVNSTSFVYKGSELGIGKHEILCVFVSSDSKTKGAVYTFSATYTK